MKNGNDSDNVKSNLNDFNAEPSGNKMNNNNNHNGAKAEASDAVTNPFTIASARLTVSEAKYMIKHMSKKPFVGINSKTQLKCFGEVFQKYMHETHDWKKRSPSAYHGM